MTPDVAIRRYLGALTTALLVCGGPANAQVIGYVFGIEGNWILSTDPARSLTAGDPIPAKGVIDARSPSRLDYIVIIDRRSGKLTRHACDPILRCTSSFPVAQPTEGREGTFTRTLDAIMKVFREEPDLISVHISRGSTWPDGLVQLVGREFLLDDILRDASQQAYGVQLRLLLPSRAQAAELERSEITWDVEGRPRVRLRKPYPGLYEMSQSEQAGGNLRIASNEVWVLAVPAARYADVANAYRDAKRLVASWGADVDEGARRAFLRAHLKLLAEDLTR